MAYSNWGGWVWADGVLREDLCDNTPVRAVGGEEYEAWALHFTRQHGDEPSRQLYHAVVGDRNSGIVVCLYKSRIGAILDSETLRPVEYEDLRVVEGENNILVSFVDRLGRKWKGISGFEIGRGWEDPPA